MFIEPSKRRQPHSKQPNSRPLHEVLAKRHYWHWCLLICSVGALLGALVGFIIGLPLMWHALLSASLGIAGFALPLRQSLAWALRWIDQSTGLSYRTALEHTGMDDPYGFAQATKARAEALTTRLETPRMQPWWVPLMVLAVGLLLIPQLTSNGLGGPSSPTSSPVQESRSDSAPADEQLGQDPDEPDPQEDAAAPAGDDEEALAGEEEADEVLDQETDGARDYDLVEGQEEASSDAAAGADSERDALDRFLEDRDDDPQERQLERAEMRQEQSTSSSQQRAQEADDDAEDGEEGTALAEEANGDDQDGSDDAASPEVAEGEGDEGDGDAEASAQAGQDGEDEDVASADGAENGDEGDPEADGARSMSDQADGMQPDEGLDDSAFPGAGAEGTEGEDRAEEPLDEGMSPFTFLQGQRDEEGPASFLGETFMPGTDEELAFPEGQAPAGFDRAIEEAISEGRIPVEYQDIVRQYFR